jgi:hypothetical protein
MRTRTTVALALAAASLFAVTAIAYADGVMLTASQTQVRYPHSVVLTVSFPTADPATATILAMRADASEWTTTTLFATTTTPTVRVKPKVTTAYKAWIGEGLVSEPVTVSVAARLVKPQIGGNIHKNRSYTIKGQMQPAEAGTVTVTFWRMEPTNQYYLRHGVGHVRRVGAWVQQSPLDLELALTTKAGSKTSKWTTKWKPLETGWWKVVVSHEDTTHVRSSATTYKWVR